MYKYYGNALYLMKSASMSIDDINKQSRLYAVIVIVCLKIVGICFDKESNHQHLSVRYSNKTMTPVNV
jgi:hypothetical protein